MASTFELKKSGDGKGWVDAPVGGCWFGAMECCRCGQGADFDEVVGEDAVSAPDLSAREDGQFGPQP
ncbi:hypothetical protein A5759_05560 [Mycobacterium sp. 852014-52144_SCH5372336]|nr:hypothetical protein A5759_05560 [Mycobacterium sp. 852014-52144_SCH5372336]